MPFKRIYGKGQGWATLSITQGQGYSTTKYRHYSVIRFEVGVSIVFTNNPCC
jgi:hypothetical protein